MTEPLFTFEVNKYGFITNMTPFRYYEDEEGWSLQDWAILQEWIQAGHPVIGEKAKPWQLKLPIVKRV